MAGTNNGWNSGARLPIAVANSTRSNIFIPSAAITTTQSLTTSTGGGNVFLCTNTGAISLTLPAANTFTNNFIDFIFDNSGTVTLIPPAGTLNGGVIGIVFQGLPVSWGARVFSDGTNYITPFGIPNGAILPLNLTLGTPSIIGQVTGSAVGAGIVGQVIKSNVPFASAISLTNSTNANITSISLTAGDWDVYGNVLISTTAGTQIIGWTSTTSATQPDQSSFSLLTTTQGTCICPMIQVNVSTTTTVYLSAVAVFVTGTATACGNIIARRRD
jgi:hypothetical protein